MFEIDFKLVIFLFNLFVIVVIKVVYNDCEDWMN